MKKTIAKKWTAALRSGKYKQTKGALRDQYGMCCLGVLCDLYAKEHGKEWVKNNWTKDKQGNASFLGCYDLLPEKVAKWAGIEANRNQKSECEVFIGSETAAYLNDEKLYNFEALANEIEKNVKTI